MKSIEKVVCKNQIIKYGKLKGWYFCNIFGLPSFKDVYILRDYISVNDYKLKEIFGDEPLLCRPDVPINTGKGNKLIRGRDVKLANINQYLKEIKDISKEGVILVSKHPSTIFTGHYIPRYKTNGAVMITFEKGNKILIEYVGPGFDVGDITRGKTVHTSVDIPWKNIYETPKDNYIFTRIIKENWFQISEEQYQFSRSKRIIELKANLKEKNIEDVINSIPNETPKLSFELFKKIYSECIEKIIYSKFQKNNNPYGIMLNIYDDKFCVFEIWNIERSLIKKNDLER